MKINRIVVKNIGPIDDIDLTLDGKSVVFAGENGSGKTILVSAIVDFIHEHLREIGFDDVMPQKGLGYSYFRMTSEKFKKNGQIKGFVWIEGSIGKEKIKYLECYGYGNKEELSSDLKIPIEDIIFPNDGDAKKIEGIIDHKKQDVAKKIVLNESIFYLPATRFEKEFWKTDAFADISFKEEDKFANSLGHSIELTSSLRENYNWLLNLAMDMLLDERMRIRNKDPIPTISEVYITDVCNIISSIINKKIRLNINRDYSNRLSLADDNGNLVVPSLSMLSLGQLLTMDIFLNIMRLGYGKAAHDICGVVVVDEIDTHLHVKLQNEVLPELMYMFPNIQFIITTHSSMFLLGLHNRKNSPKIISLPDGDEIVPDDFSELNEVFDKITKTKKYISSINREINNIKKPLLLVEDEYSNIYKVAWLKINNIEFKEDEINEIFEKRAPFKILGKQGRKELQKFLDQQKMDEILDKKIVGLFDFDNAFNDFNGLNTARWSNLTGDDTDGISRMRKDYKNIHAMLLPVPQHRKKYANKKLKGESRLEIELLFRDDVIIEYCDEVDTLGGGKILQFTKDKKNFWKEAAKFKKEDFDPFKPLFEKVKELLEIKEK